MMRFAKLATTQKMRARGILLAATLMTLIVPAAAWANDPAATLRELLVQYRCPVVDRLEQMYQAVGASGPRNPFLIIELAARPQDYVQCVFNSATRMLCEASSGFYHGIPGQPRTYRLAPNALAALAHLGFSTDDSAGNFQISFDVSSPPDLNRIADLMLKTLHDGYGARAGVSLLFNVPLAPRATSKCIPVS